MITPAVVALALTVAADLHVHAVDACVSADDVAAAFADDPIDVAELVTVSVLRNDAPDEPYRLLVTASLIGAPLLARETTLRPIECADVPALVRVWIKAQRTTLLPPTTLTPTTLTPPTTPPSTTTTPKQTTPTPTTTKPEAPRYLLDDAELQLGGPPELMGLGLNLGVGPSGSDFHASVDASYDVWGPVAVVAGAHVAADGGGGLTPGGQVGARAIARIFELDVSLRGLVMGGRGRDRAAVAAALNDCLDDDVAKVSDRVVSRAYVGPVVGVRARYGWLFIEGGSLWRVGLDPQPSLYGVVGVTIIGR